MPLRKLKVQSSLFHGKQKTVPQSGNGNFSKIVLYSSQHVTLPRICPCKCSEQNPVWGNTGTSVADPDPDPPDPHVFGPPGCGSGSISQRHGSADPDPPQDVMDPQH
jgi:hypothetical protein